ncbi:MAG TPA: hypothetical protein VJN64_14385 [Terriglobales bacterium]|nr:hypothetical protein [Terriglobales bacterium]
MLFAVVDQDFAVHGLEGIAMNEDGGALIDADAQQPRMSGDDRIEVVFAIEWPIRSARRSRLHGRGLS